MRTLVFESAEALTPVKYGEWPGSRENNLYWYAKAEFNVDEAPCDFSMKVAVDREYKIYLNSDLVVEQRNHFNGGKYLFGQHWYTRNHPCGESTEERKPCFIGGGQNKIKNGRNIIEVVVRSDVNGTKDYVFFHPFIMLEILDAEGRVVVASGPTWKISELHFWRETIALAISITHEKVYPVHTAKHGVGGIPEPVKLFTPFLLDINSFPPLYEWTDFPVENRKHRRGKVISTGQCLFSSQALVFRISEIFKLSENAVLTVEIDSSEGMVIPVSMSAMCQCEIFVNGVFIASRDTLPGACLMRQYNYASPAFELTLAKGINKLEIRFGEGHKRFIKWAEKYAGIFNIAGLDFKIIPHGAKIGRCSVEASEIQPHLYDEALCDVLSAKGHLEKDDGGIFDISVDGIVLEAAKASVKNYAILDFGATIKAELSFKIKADSGGKIYLAYGIMDESGASDCSRNGRKAVDVIEVTAGESVYRTWERRVFVYLDIVFEGFDGRVEIKDFLADEKIFYGAQNINFSTSDILMNNIFKSGVRTAQLCCDEIYMDNPEREHGQWVDNLHHISGAGYYIFGETLKPAKTLKEFMFLQYPDGQLPGHSGAWGGRTPLQGHIALYIQALWRYYMFTGDRDTLVTLYPGILRIIDFWSGFLNSDGLLENLETLFIDWGVHIYSYCPEVSDPPPVGVNTAMNAYYLRCLRIVSELAEYLGDTSNKIRFAEEAETHCSKMRELLFDEAFGLFRDGMKNRLAENNFSQAANALSVLAGAVPGKQGKMILEKVFSWQGQDIIPASAHFTFQAGEALFAADLDKLAFQWLKKVYGPMINDRSGTLWETTEPWVSHCQGTSSGLLYLLARYHGGFFPFEPGFREIGINPMNCGQKSFKSVFMTSYGKVGISWIFDSGCYDYVLELPDSLKKRKINIVGNVNLSVI